jgi:hypothetical protein
MKQLQQKGNIQMATGLGFGSSQPGRVLSALKQASPISRRRLYVIGAAVQAEVQGFIRGNCLQEEVERLGEIHELWKKARAHFRSLEATEAFLPEKVRVNETEPELGSFLAQLRNDPLFERAYGEAPYQIKKVELRNLVACQRHVDLDFVDTLKERLTQSMTREQLAAFCLLPAIAPPLPKCQQLAPNVYGFSSPNTDFRFLGGFVRPLTQEDVQACWMGGEPAAAVVLLLGYGAPSMNAFQVGQRIVLSNGFHRAYALLSCGISDAYLVVRNVADPGLEFPAQLVGLPREYLLGSPRPAVVGDFLNPSLVQEFECTVGVRSIQLAWNANQTQVPI